MNRTPLFLIAAAVVSLPAFADEAAVAAQKAKLITSIQEKLGVPAGGKMDAKTEAALKQFQRAKGIEPTGKLDKKTLTALGMGEPKPKPAAAGASAKGRPSTPIGPQQSSGERAAEPTLKHDRPTGETK
jgi:peptidoglycan hydrolase-like protein with peptidoglycan-binding domain